MEFHPYESFDKNKAQNQVWEWIKSAFRSNIGEAYYRYPIFSRTGNLVREPDFLILDQDTGLWVIECKGCSIENIESIHGHEWKMRNWHSEIETPIAQAEDQMFAIQNKLTVRREARGKLQYHFRVALPNVKRQEWIDSGFDGLPSTGGSVLVYEDLTPASLKKHFEQFKDGQKEWDVESWKLIYGVLGGTLQSKPARNIPTKTPTDSPLRAIHEVESNLKVLDKTQQEIAFEVPDGPQRLRGLAGTGKTVLLAQRLAKMHIAHPDWEIGFVFFTRSLYDQIIGLVDLFHREMHPDHIEPNWQKVKVLHAWGGKSKEGFYYRLAQKCGIHPHTLDSAKDASRGQSQSPSEVFEFICQELAKKADDIPILYDCLLIDEGQDLPPIFYQLAYKTLSDPRRLYWAYDEAQGIGSLIIPNSKEVFGQELNGKNIVDVSGSYSGGIKKSRKMKHCYRTPRQLLMTAHAVNMGLFRQGGALQGVTKKDDWKDLGYEVLDGDFSDASVKAGKTVTITRPSTQSPHPVDSEDFQAKPSLGSLLSVTTFADENSEIYWIAQKIKADIDAGLDPWDIIVTCIAGDDERQYREKLKSALLEVDVKSIIAGVDTSPDIFRRDGCVTISGIARAKGNEAWKVYACRFHYATQPLGWKQESELHKRNEAFVALTRSRLWCVVTGMDSEIFDEIQTAIEQYPNFAFLAFNEKSLKRCQDDDNEDRTSAA